MTLPLPPGFSPRAWQIEAVEAAKCALREHQAVIVSAATGTGKGSVIAGIGVMSAKKGRRVLMLAHREELLEELVARVRMIPEAPSVGLVKGARNELLNPIVVASVQSLGLKRLKQLGKVGLVLTDECHHALAPTYQRIYDHVASQNERYKHIGFTATPFRTGKEAGTTLGLGKVFQAVAYEYGIGDAIAAGDLVSPRGFRVATQISLEGVRNGADGDFLEDDLARRLDVPARNELVAQEYLARCPGKPALVFCCSIEHSQHMAESFRKLGIRAEAVWGVMPAGKRREFITRYKDRLGVDVLCSRDLIFEGFDAPQTAAIFQARPTQSRVVFTQMIGRGLRIYAGKSECVVVSFVDRAGGLDLATLTDLRPDDANERVVTALDVGDLVLRRRHEGWGVGEIREVSESEDTRLLYVKWPATAANPGGAVRPHTLQDLARAPEEEEAEQGQLLTIEPKVSGVKRYDMLLLPGASPKSSPGWYEYRGTWSCSARRAVPGGKAERQHDGTWRPAATETLAFHVRQEDRRWQAWSLQREQGETHDRAELVGDAPDRDAALGLAGARIVELGAKVSPIDADWKAHPASAKQVAALRAWGIRRDCTKLSKGEASALMDAVRCHRLTGQHLRPARAGSVAA